MTQQASNLLLDDLCPMYVSITSKTICLYATDAKLKVEETFCHLYNFL